MMQVMRLNQMLYCDGCGTMVNPYVIERKPETNVAKVECPNCEHSWKEELSHHDDAA